MLVGSKSYAPRIQEILSYNQGGKIWFFQLNQSFDTVVSRGFAVLPTPPGILQTTISVSRWSACILQQLVMAA